MQGERLEFDVSMFGKHGGGGRSKGVGSGGHGTCSCKSAEEWGGGKGSRGERSEGVFVRGRVRKWRIKFKEWSGGSGSGGSRSGTLVSCIHTDACASSSSTAAAQHQPIMFLQLH